MTDKKISTFLFSNIFYHNVCIYPISLSFCRFIKQITIIENHSLFF